MRLGLVLVTICVAVGSAAWLAAPALAECEHLRERIDQIHGELAQLDGEKGGLLAELHDDPEPARRDEIEGHVGQIEQHEMRLHEELGDVERQLAECQNGNGERRDVPPVIIAAIITAIGAIIAAVAAALLRRR